jgi:hypothetical protein
VRDDNEGRPDVTLASGNTPLREDDVRRMGAGGRMEAGGARPCDGDGSSLARDAFGRTELGTTGLPELWVRAAAELLVLLLRLLKPFELGGLGIGVLRGPLRLAFVSGPPSSPALFWS